MTRKIFIYTFFLGALVLILCIVTIFAMQYTQTLDENFETLEGEASYAVKGFQIGGIRYLKSVGNTNRITWISGEGEVLYDSVFPEGGPNQAMESEVRQALANGTGRAIRYSASGEMQMMYYAVLCPDGTVLRLSRSLSAVQEAFMTVSPVLWLIILVLFISAAMAFRIARTIAEPVNEIELENLAETAPYPELQPLVERLREQKETIARQAVEQEQVRREAAEAQAREQERMRREFSANVSHELKTPLTSISGFAELMRSGFCDEEKMIEFAGDIYQESQRLIALVNDIIRISEMDEGVVPQLSESVDLVQAAEEAVRILCPSAEKKGISMEVMVSADGENARDGGQTQSICVSGSERLIGEMLYNLCDNAVQYNRENGKVIVRVCQEDDSVCVSVEDTGIGIPPEEQERVFERFYRVDKSHSRQVGGTGLGLSIVKHAAQLHDASIEMDSRPGRGTRITVRFPK